METKRTGKELGRWKPSYDYLLVHREEDVPEICYLLTFGISYYQKFALLLDYNDT